MNKLTVVPTLAAALAAQPAYAEEDQGNPPAGTPVVLGYDNSVPVEVGGYYFKAGDDGTLAAAEYCVAANQTDEG